MSISGFLFVVLYLIETSSSWQVTNAAQSSSNWIVASFSDEDWDTVEGDTNVYYTGTVYIRRRFTGISNMAAYELTYYLQYGVVIYVNGKEVFRDNMLEYELVLVGEV